jgi:hypothetical protein
VISRSSVPLITVELRKSRQGSGTTVFDYDSPFTGIKHAEVSNFGWEFVRCRHRHRDGGSVLEFYGPQIGTAGKCTSTLSIGWLN